MFQFWFWNCVYFKYIDVQNAMHLQMLESDLLSKYSVKINKMEKEKKNKEKSWTAKVVSHWWVII